MYEFKKYYNDIPIEQKEYINPQPRREFTSLIYK